MSFLLRAHRARRRGCAGVEAEPPAAESVRLVSLLAVVSRAVELQAEADGVIRACALPGDTPGSVARRGQRVAADYGRLYGWALDLGQHQRPDSLSRQVAELVQYHIQILDVSLKLAFPKFRSPNLERRRLALTGLGAPAQRLREAETTLRTALAERGGW